MVISFNRCIQYTPTINSEIPKTVLPKILFFCKTHNSRVLDHDRSLFSLTKTIFKTSLDHSRYPSCANFSFFFKTMELMFCRRSRYTVLSYLLKIYCINLILITTICLDNFLWCESSLFCVWLISCGFFLSWYIFLFCESSVMFWISLQSYWGMIMNFWLKVSGKFQNWKGGFYEALRYNLML